MTNSSGTTKAVKDFVQRHRIVQLLVIIIIAIIGVAVISFIFKSIGGDPKLIDKLSRIEYARGLITFVFAVGTITIALILVIAGLLQQVQDAGERFNRGKEVLTILVGIFGTILGFYFGTETSQQSEVTEQVLKIETSSFNFVTDQNDVTLIVEASIIGGEPPYKYSITFKPPEIEPVKGESIDGSIERQVPVSQVAMGKETTASLTVTDKNNVEVSVEEKLKIGATKQNSAGS